MQKKFRITDIKATCLSERHTKILLKQHLISRKVFKKVVMLSTEKSLARHLDPKFFWNDKQSFENFSLLQGEKILLPSLQLSEWTEENFAQYDNQVIQN